MRSGEEKVVEGEGGFSGVPEGDENGDGDGGEEDAEDGRGPCFHESR